MTPLEAALAVRDLGLDVVIEDKPVTNSFAPGVWMEDSKIFVCPWAAQVGDILHEAGHMAIIPSRFRSAVRRGNVEGPEFIAAVEAYTHSEECFENGPDHWLMKALLQMGDCEAQAWSYAAAHHIGYPTRDAFCFTYEGVPQERQPYGGEGEEVWHGLHLGRHFGINGMQAAGMTTVRGWPTMLRWVQP